MPGDSLIIDPWHQPEDGKVGHWLPAFETPALVDASGRGNTATNNGSTITTSSRGPVRNFDGVDDYINTGDVAVPQLTTITLWADFSGAPDWAISAGYATSGYDDFRFIVARKTNTGAIVSYVKDGTGALKVASYGVVSTGPWHHYSAVADELELRIYLDGEFVTSTIKSAGILSTGTTGFTIGRQHNRTSGWYKGHIDDVRIHNRTLPAAEVRDLYKRTKEPPSPRRRVYSIPAVAADTSTAGTFRRERYDPWNHPENGLVGHWLPAWETPALVDASGRGNTGVLSGTVNQRPVIAVHGGRLCRFWEGTNDYIDVSSLDVTGMGDCTVMAWFRPSTAAAQRMIIGTGSANRFYIETHSTGPVVHWGMGADNNLATSTVTPQDNVWMHYAVTKTGTTSGTVQAYANGQAEDSKAWSGGHGGGALYIGQYGSAGGLNFNGGISDVRIYNRLLPAAEIRELYERTKSPPSPRRDVYSVTAAPPAATAPQLTLLGVG